jgi:hypothetical protein
MPSEGAPTTEQPHRDALDHVVEQWQLEESLGPDLRCDFPDHGAYNGRIPPCRGEVVARAILHNHHGNWCESAVEWVKSTSPIVHSINCGLCHKPFAQGHPVLVAI